MSAQLDFYGGEHTAAPAATALTCAQREILRAVRVYGTITSTAAGRIIHAHREPRCSSCANGACRFASSDGRDALVRLRDRGLVQRRRAGVWAAAS